MTDAIAAGGGVIIAIGALFIAFDVFGEEFEHSNGAALVMAALLASSFVALAMLPNATHPAWIATTAISIPFIFGLLFLPDANDFGDARPFFLLTIAAWVLAFFLPWSRGRGVFAALAMTLLWAWAVAEVALPDEYTASRLVPPYVSPVDQFDAIRGHSDADVVTAAFPAQTTLDELDSGDPLYPLAEECENGDDAACDDLWNDSDPGSDFEAFANTCGGRYSDDNATGGCEALSSGEEITLEDLDSGDPLYSLAEECADGDDAACDDLYQQSPFGSDFETFADSCGGRETSGSGSFCDASSGSGDDDVTDDTFDFDDEFEDDFFDDGFDDGFDDDLSEEFFGPSPVGPEDDIAMDIGIVSAIFAALYLGALRVLDRRGMQGIGTAFVIPGILTLGTAVSAFSIELENLVMASLLSVAAGMLLSFIGHLGGHRRFTTWYGAYFASIGTFVLALEVADIEKSGDNGELDLIEPALVTLAFGLALVAVAYLLARAIFGSPGEPGGTVPPPTPPSEPLTTTWTPAPPPPAPAWDPPTTPTPTIPPAPPAPSPPPPDPGATWGPPKEPDPPPGGWGAPPTPAPPPPFES